MKILQMVRVATLLKKETLLKKDLPTAVSELTVCRFLLYEIGVFE